MKKVFYFISGLVVFLVLAMILIPVFFKDDIAKQVDKILAESVNAEIRYNPEEFDLSFFSHFPHLTVGMGEVSVIGKDIFAGDTLASLKSFQASVNPFSALAGKLDVGGVYLTAPRVHVIVTEDGKANYDIAKPSEEQPSKENKAEEGEESGPATFKIAIQEWAVTDANIIYDDRQQKVLLAISKLNHEGAGDFTADVFNLDTRTTVDDLNLTYDGTEYLSEKQLDATVSLLMDMPNQSFTFRENDIKLNDFGFGFDGNVKLDKDDIITDITFASKESTFKSILSLVPGVFTKDFEDIKTEGKFKLDGFVKGLYRNETLPGFGLNLSVNDGFFKYPDLPQDIHDINVAMSVDHKEGPMESTSVNVSSLKLSLGNNPISGNVLVKNLRNYDMDAALQAKVNLADFGQLVPMDSLDLKGTFALGLKASGYYDSVKHILPAIDATASLKNGYVKTAEFPIPLQNLQFNATAVNKTGKNADLVVSVPDFGVSMGTDRFTANMKLFNLDDISWIINAEGGLNLAVIADAFLPKDMKMAGTMKANLNTRGKLSDAQAQRYAKLPTSGAVTLSNFKFQSPDLPKGMDIPTATLTFDPKKIELKDFSAKFDNSDIRATGSVGNYIAYALEKNATLTGILDVNSNYFDLNQFMSEEEAPADSVKAETTAKTETENTEEGVILVPKNLDLTLTTNMKKVDVTGISILDAKGKITVKNGKANLKDVTFTTLGGSVAMNGAYDTGNPEIPKFDYTLNVKEISFQKTYQAFTTVQKMAPIAGDITGDYSANFVIEGKLGKAMSPVYESLNGNGTVKIKDAALKDNELIGKINKLAKIGSKNMRLENTTVKAKIVNGKVITEPFDIKLDKYKATVSGWNDFTGHAVYDMAVLVPAKGVSNAVNSLISNLTKTKTEAIGSTLQVNLELTRKPSGDKSSTSVKLKGIKTIKGKGQTSGQTKKKEDKKKDIGKEVEKALKGLF
ncbi:hypothetical protein FUAX_03610 [Fulvitalea axinellae]|uniref:AsmA domain-containing protein n=1 Tax=Fulvitalea axinellae TaxID=1182444 RepID=A0AAU9CNK4_9BACT|nr:hypothetical protein FUAX_03610 [Fulvitalea axinellae]